MYRYVNDISELAQDIIKRYSVRFDLAVDCTLGNGHDCDFLRENFKNVYAFDIQEDAVNSYKERMHCNVTCICDSHSEIRKYINEEIDAITFNLGYLPGGDKEITTKADSSIEAISVGMDMLRKGGIMTVAVYHGHEAGKEEKEKVLKFLQKANPKAYGVMVHTFHNRSKYAPLLIVIEKKAENVES